MKIFIMTDLEGVAGVLDFDEWTSPESIYFNDAKKFLTMEVNAAVEGFFEAGATEINVCDGHGDRGINPEILDKRVGLINGKLSRWPFYIDDTYDCVAWVGQHAKAGSEYAHLAHTWDISYIDYRINGISVGELGIMAIIASSFGVKPIFCSGDHALKKEAEELLPGIVAVEVKRGLVPGTGNECSCEEYSDRNLDALHMHPEMARKRIYEGARTALERFINDKESFKYLKVNPPFIKEASFRKEGENPAWIGYAEHPDDVVALANMDEKKP